jgi:hypothetical protein
MALGSIATAVAGGEVRRRLRRTAIMAVVWSIAVVLLLAAFATGLIAAYLGLRLVPLGALEAMGILAGALLLAALVVVVVGRLAVDRRRRSRAALPAPVSLASLAIGQALGGVRPAHLLIAAFVAGAAVELLGERDRH